MQTTISRFPVLSLLAALVLIACHPAVEIERRVPVDMVADCMSLRERLSQCPQEAAGLMLDRQKRKDPTLQARLVDPAARETAEKDLIDDLTREADMPVEDRRNQCRQATADAPPPIPEDVANLHRCLAMSCAQRVRCLRPLMLPEKHKQAAAL